MRSITLRSPSKINLHLRVAAPDASGFHPLRSWFVTTDLCDELTCRIEATPGRRSVKVTCDVPTIPTDATNLVARAADAYLGALWAGAGDVAVTFELTKRIPAGAGMGGGSGNAATALVALDRLLAADGAHRPDLATLAATLGSDVPFFLGPPSAIATGRGERLLPTPAPAARFALLLFPPFGVPTPAAYHMLDEIRPVARDDVLDSIDVGAWSRLDARALSDRLINDLEPAAFALAPELAALRATAEATLGRPVRMSGSGSTLFALYDAEDEAAAAGASVEVRSQVVRLGTATIESPVSSTIF